MRLRVGLELGRAVDVERARHEQRLDQQVEIGDEGEILVGVVRQLVEDEWVDGERIVVDETERVAVRRRLHAGLGAGNAACAAPVLDHDGWPSRGVNSLAVARMMTSVTLPAAIGTITRIGRSG